MFLVEMRYEPFKPDIENYKRELRAGMKRLMQDAIAEFVRTIIYDDLVHVDTGMSAASLHDAAVAARMWGEAQAAIVFKRKNTRRKGLTTMGGNYDSSQYREMKAGIAAANKATKISFDLPLMEFNFDIRVFQWYYWEVMQGQWDALDTGARAFIDYINANATSYVPGFEHLFK